MLKKSFKPAKCKTALNLAKSRIKLMKNKKNAQLTQLRREVSQLLLNGQDQTARIRVEHVVREEKMLAAYEMIEIYCELVVARLPIIESQKICPLDLKEAVTSLIFAAPRCGDIPELQDIRKHFTAKYGKDFSNAAVELHPACGVSRTLVENLSVKAPDGPAKVKILKGIAEEYNIQWEPNWFKDEVPVSSGDILKIPHMVNSNTMQTKPVNVQPDNNFEEKHSRSSENPEKSSQSYVRANSNVIPKSSFSRSDSSASENLFSPSSRTAENPGSAGRQWNIEFKDATAAAQAAAECAEQASFAARAAAQLSIRDSYRGPGCSSEHGEHEGDRRFAESVFQERHEHETPINRSFNQRSPRMQEHRGYTHQQGDMTERRDDRRSNREFAESEVQHDNRRQERKESESASHRVNADRLSKLREPVSTPSASKGDYDWSNSSNMQEYGVELDENPFHVDTLGSSNQPDKFQSQSSGFDDGNGAFSNLNHGRDDFDTDISFGTFGRGTSEQENWHAETRDYDERDLYKESDEPKHRFNSASGVFIAMDQGTQGYNDDNVGRNVASAVFDESASDVDEDDDYIPSPRHSSIQKENHHFEPDLSESFRKSSIYTKLIKPMPVTFDDDDKPTPGRVDEVQTEDSDSETGGDNYRKPSADSQRTTELFRASSAEKVTAYSVKSNKYMEENHSTFAETADEGKVFESPRSFLLPSGSKNHAPDFDDETYCTSEGSLELKLRSLAGGRRNRPSWRPPYTTGESSGVSSPSKFSEAANERFAPTEGSSPSKFQMSFGRTASNYEAAISPSHSERSYSGSTHENIHGTRAKDTTRYFESDESSPDEDVPKPVITKKLLGGGISRRTKGSRLVSSRPSPKRHTETTSSSSSNVGQSSLSHDATYEVSSGTKASINKNSFSLTDVEKPGTPKNAGISRSSVSTEKVPSRENSGKNLSHVHPKLPDFETFAAHLKSLRTDRR